MRPAALLRLLLAAAIAVAAAAAGSKPLPVVLYGESLCDDTAHYIVDVLGKQNWPHCAPMQLAVAARPAPTGIQRASSPTLPPLPMRPSGPLFVDGISSHMALRYEAYGNAKLNSTTVRGSSQQGARWCAGSRGPIAASASTHVTPWMPHRHLPPSSRPLLK